MKHEEDDDEGVAQSRGEGSVTSTPAVGRLKTLTTQKLHKILRDAGHRRSERHASSRVRGWGNSTEGYELKKIETNERYARRGQRWVKVGADLVGFDLRHIAGSWSHLQGEERAASVSAKLDAYAKALSAAGIACRRDGDVLHVNRSIEVTDNRI